MSGSGQRRVRTHSQFHRQRKLWPILRMSAEWHFETAAGEKWDGRVEGWEVRMQREKKKMKKN